MTASRWRRGFLIPLIFTLIALAVLLALGTWQLERKAWKESLIATIQNRLSAPSAGLPPRDQWDKLDRAQMEFRRVAFSAEFLHEREALVYTSGSALRPDIWGPGYWVLTPARVPGGGLVIVNRGFVPEGKQSAVSRPEGQIRALNVVGVMRWPEPPGLFTPKGDAAQKIFFVRDPVAIAAAIGWGAVAPFYIEQETPPFPGGLPQVGRIQANLRNNHLQYAITWYGLAAALIGLFGYWLRSQAYETP